MPETKEYTVYKFEELSDRAKEKARQWWRDCEDQDFDTDYMYEDFQRMAALIGIEFDQKPVKLMGGGTRYDPTIYWTGFYSQGDGACFVGRYAYAKGAVKALEAETGGSEHALIKIAATLQRLQAKHFYGLTARIEHHDRYCHEYSMDIDVCGRDGFSVDHALGKEVAECFSDFARWMYKSLEAEHDYRMSDENVDESIDINEYTFDEDGNRED